MQAKILLASLAASVSANDLLALRQVNSPLGALSKECQADLAEVQAASDLPTIPTAFISDAFLRAQTLSDPCDYTPTGSVASEYTSFVEAAEAWASAHTSIASKIEEDCNANLQNIANLCPSGKGAATGGAGGAEATTTGTEASATGSDGEASKETQVGKSAAVANGPAAAAALLIAALGAVALL